MNPKPFVSLNHFTVPVAIFLFPLLSYLLSEVVGSRAISGSVATTSSSFWLRRHALFGGPVRMLGHHGNRFPDQSFDVAKLLPLFGIAERECRSRGSGARRSADTVYVRL